MLTYILHAVEDSDGGRPKRKLDVCGDQMTELNAEMDAIRMIAVAKVEHATDDF